MDRGAEVTCQVHRAIRVDTLKSLENGKVFILVQVRIKWGYVLFFHLLLKIFYIFSLFFKHYFFIG